MKWYCLRFCLWGISQTEVTDSAEEFGKRISGLYEVLDATSVIESCTVSAHSADEAYEKSKKVF